MSGEPSKQPAEHADPDARQSLSQRTLTSCLDLQSTCISRTHALANTFRLQKLCAEATRSGTYSRSCGDVDVVWAASSAEVSQYIPGAVLFRLFACFSDRLLLRADPCYPGRSHIHKSVTSLRVPFSCSPLFVHVARLAYLSP
jgi:hypothetical protein